MSNLDPIFKLPKPAIFAHRGGAAEAPESTIDGFLHGLRNGANIIEVDIQLSRDGEPIVWHGPELDIAFNKDNKYMEDNFVSCWEWKDLRNLWVRHPNPKNPADQMQQIDNRRLISLSQLLDFIADVKNGKHDPKLGKRPIHLNIELKKTSKKGTCECKPSWTHNNVANSQDHYPYLHKVLNILENAPNDVTIIVGSVDHHILSCFRQILNGKYKTNLSLKELKPYAGQFDASRIKLSGMLIPFIKILLKGIGWVCQRVIKKKECLLEFAFETPSSIINKKIVDEVHLKGGGVYAFLSPFPMLQQPEEDKCSVASVEYSKAIEELINMGVDGLMTDYPSELKKILGQLGVP